MKGPNRILFIMPSKEANVDCAQINASEQPTPSSATFHHARILNFAPFGGAFRTKFVGQWDKISDKAAKAITCQRDS